MDERVREAGVEPAARTLSQSGHPPHPVRATIRHTLSARFVEIDEPAVEEFERDGVLIRVDARVRESHSFATIICSGSIEIDRAAALPDTGEYVPFLSRDGHFAQHEREARHAWSRIEPVLQHVGAVMRWRFGMFGDDPLWTSSDVVLEAHGEVVELTPMPRQPWATRWPGLFRTACAMWPNWSASRRPNRSPTSCGARRGTSNTPARAAVW